MFNNNAAFKCETSYKGEFNITQCCTGYTVTLQYGAIKIGYNIRHIEPYTSYTHIEGVFSEK